MTRLLVALRDRLFSWTRRKRSRSR